MKIETLVNRISKAEETIAKKQNTISKKLTLISKKEDKIRKLGGNPQNAKHSDVNDIAWLAYDIENLKDDIKRLNDEIEEKQISLAKYKEEYQKEIEKSNSRNVKAIIDFLEDWKEKVKEYYSNSLTNWIETLNNYYAESKRYTEWYNGGGFKTSKEEKKNMKRKCDNLKAAHAQWSFLDRYIEKRNINGKREYSINSELLQKDLDYEANCKYDFIIERVNEIVGQITDASHLSVGNKGDLNGIIIGVKGKASVKTIDAGGYNVQCYHFRTLVEKV